MEGASSTTNTVDFSGLLSALTGSISPAQVLAVLAAVIGVGMGFFLMWLGARKAIRAFTSSVSSGKLQL